MEQNIGLCLEEHEEDSRQDQVVGEEDELKEHQVLEEELLDQEDC
jgi:hypothetical protein